MKNGTDTNVTIYPPILDSPSQVVAVLGTGNFGQAIAKRLSQGGVPFVIGSRSPRTLPNGLVAIDQEDAINQSGLILLAVPFQAFETVPMKCMTPGQIVVDCSNRAKPCSPKNMSHAEQLHGMLPHGVQVVKALNGLSAHELETRESGGRSLPMASDSKEAKGRVSSLIERIGYRGLDFGSLAVSRELENAPLTLFPQWRGPLVVTICLWVLFYLMEFGRYYLCPHNEWGWWPSEPNHAITNMYHYDLIKTFDATALTMLAACYLPGVLAAYLQLWRGTKYSEFPNWLDRWMQMRKQLGLLVVVCANIHSMLYLLFFDEILEGGPTWQDKGLMTFGVLSFTLLLILTFTSLPSVTQSLSWHEFRLIQSWGGWIALILCTVHTIFAGLVPNESGHYKVFTWNHCVFFDTKQIPLILPFFTFCLKFPLLFPCVDRRLTKIRQGKVF